MNDEKRGLYWKYIVRKTGSGAIVKNSFVLKPESDPAALTALKAYADATFNSHLRFDLEKWIEVCEKKTFERRKKAVDKLDPPKCESCGKDMVKYAYNEDGWWLYWDCADEDDIGHDPIDIDWSAIFHPNAKVNGITLRKLGFEVV